MELSTFEQEEMRDYSKEQLSKLYNSDQIEDKTYMSQMLSEESSIHFLNSTCKELNAQSNVDNDLRKVENETFNSSKSYFENDFNDSFELGSNFCHSFEIDKNYDEKGKNRCDMPDSIKSSVTEFEKNETNKNHKSDCMNETTEKDSICSEANSSNISLILAEHNYTILEYKENPNTPSSNSSNGSDLELLLLKIRELTTNLKDEIDVNSEIFELTDIIHQKLVSHSVPKNMNEREQSNVVSKNNFAILLQACEIQNGNTEAIIGTVEKNKNQSSLHDEDYDTRSKSDVKENMEKTKLSQEDEVMIDKLNVDSKKTNGNCEKEQQECDTNKRESATTTIKNLNEVNSKSNSNQSKPSECEQSNDEISFEQKENSNNLQEIVNEKNVSLRSDENLNLNKTIQDLKVFAKKLYKNCEEYEKLPTIEIQKFVIREVEELKKLTRNCTQNYIEMAIQTEEEWTFKENQMKMNENTKRRLLEFSGDESSSSDDGHELKKKNLKCPFLFDEKDKKAIENVDSLELTSMKTTVDNFNEFEENKNRNELFVDNDIFNNIDMESEFNDIKETSNGTLELENVKDIISQDEKLNSKPVVVLKKLLEEDIENCLDKLQEKEINRLLNYENLINPKVTQMTNIKQKVRDRRNRSNSKFSETNSEDETYSSSDISTSDQDDKSITEKEYLEKCNLNLKKQLLDTSSSSESEKEDDTSDIDDSISSKSSNSSDNSNESRSSSITEDKQSILRNKLMHDNSENIDVNLNKDNEEVSVKQSDKNQNEINEDKNENKSENIKIEKSINFKLSSDKSFNRKVTTNRDGSDSSDCEILNDICSKTTTKKQSTKTIEELVESKKLKRCSKNPDDLISLSSSSETECEETPADENMSKRMLKPMLRQDQLAGETRIAQKQEVERIRRLKKKQQMLKEAYEKHKNEKNSDDINSRLILDYDPEKKCFIEVHPEIVKHLKRHQIDGIKFMYDNCYGSVKYLKNHPGSGCILAHCMGLGKTLQLIALLHTVINYKELDTSKVLILCPKSTIMNWRDEIYRWIGHIKKNVIKLFYFQDSSDIQNKLRILEEWSECGMPGIKRAGVLLIGYELFRTLVFCNIKGKKGNITPKERDIISKKIKKFLLEPGADLVVCDEGHIIKNRKAAISEAVTQIKTRRRIMLTGTPIQNNLKEYYSMVNFIKPSFLGTDREFNNLYANPIKNGQHKDSSKNDIKIMKQRSFVLHKKLSDFVQRREAGLLKTFLPEKHEYVLFIPMTEVQNNLYEYFLMCISKRQGSKGKCLIPDYTCLRKIWTHPKVLEIAWKNAIEKGKKDPPKQVVPTLNSDDELPDDVYDNQTGELSVTNDWWRPMLEKDDLETLLPSNKLRIMFEILRVCEENEEKCLIFSAFVAVLNVVEHFMQQINNQNYKLTSKTGFEHFKGPWVLNKDYYRLDGKTSKTLRHELVKQFNDPKNKRTRCFLISAKAGGQGINLIGANRVIILDTSWNPSNDQQNIFRIFRLGQKKRCFVYRLLSMGTMEEKVYSRSVTKQAMSFRVVDEQQIDRHYSMAELTELYTLTKPNYEERPVPILPQDNILASLLRYFPNLIYKYHEHDSLLESKLEQELSEEEKRDAWAQYERDLQMNEDSAMAAANIESHGTNFNFPDAFYNQKAYPIPFGFSPLSMANYNYQTANPMFGLYSMYNNFTDYSQYMSRMNQTPMSPMSPMSTMKNLQAAYNMQNFIQPTANNIATANMLPPNPSGTPLSNFSSYKTLSNTPQSSYNPTSATGNFGAYPSLCNNTTSNNHPDYLFNDLRKLLQNSVTSTLTPPRNQLQQPSATANYPNSSTSKPNPFAIFLNSVPNSSNYTDPCITKKPDAPLKSIEKNILENRELDTSSPNMMNRKSIEDRVAFSNRGSKKNNYSETSHSGQFGGNFGVSTGPASNITVRSVNSINEGGGGGSMTTKPTNSVSISLGNSSSFNANNSQMNERNILQSKFKSLISPTNSLTSHKTEKVPIRTEKSNSGSPGTAKLITDTKTLPQNTQTYTNILMNESTKSNNTQNIGKKILPSTITSNSTSSTTISNPFNSNTNSKNKSENTSTQITMIPKNKTTSMVSKNKETSSKPIAIESKNTPNIGLKTGGSKVFQTPADKLQTIINKTSQIRSNNKNDKKINILTKKNQIRNIDQIISLSDKSKIQALGNKNVSSSDVRSSSLISSDGLTIKKIPSNLIITPDLNTRTPETKEPGVSKLITTSARQRNIMEMKKDTSSTSVAATLSSLKNNNNNVTIKRKGETAPKRPLSSILKTVSGDDPNSIKRARKMVSPVTLSP